MGGDAGDDCGGKCAGWCGGVGEMIGHRVDWQWLGTLLPLYLCRLTGVIYMAQTEIMIVDGGWDVGSIEPLVHGWWVVCLS